MPEPQPHVLRLKIDGMTCAACANRLERVLNKTAGVQASVNFATETAIVRTENVPNDWVFDKVLQAGFQAREATPQASAGPSAEPFDFITPLTLLLASPFALEMVGMLMGRHHLIPPWWAAVLATVIQSVGAWAFYRGAWSAARAKSANMDTLVVLGTTAAFLMSWWLLLFGEPGEMLYFEASAMVVAFVRLGKMLEGRAKRKTRAALSSLMQLAPRFAHRILPSGEVVDVPVDSVFKGDVLQVQAGDTIPVDGLVLQGLSDVDEQSLTGESLPQTKQTGDTVWAATRNVDGVLRIQATSTGGQTRHAQIVAAVAHAQGSKAPIQALADRVSAWFVPIVLLIAVFAGAYAAFIEALSIEAAILRSVAVLVVACPCALGLATPVAVMVGVGRGAHRGILFANAEALQRLAQVNHLVFDKTGTLTQGALDVVAVALPTDTGFVTHPTSHQSPPESDAILAVLRSAGCAEQGSQHPIGRALTRWVNPDSPAPTQATTEAGQGVTAHLQDGTVLKVGRPTWVGFSYTPEAQQGTAWVGVAVNESPTGLIALKDQARPEAADAVDSLHQRGLRTSILSGDHPAVVEHFAQQLHIQSAEGHCTPESKAQSIRGHQNKGDVVAMVGDGINDAVALAAADVGIAVGSGTDVALETADIGLMRNDLRLVPEALALAQAVMTVIRQNLFFAFAFNAIGLPLAAFGVLPPALSGAAMASSSVIVVTNALRLSRWRGTLSAT